MAIIPGNFLAKQPLRAVWNFCNPKPCHPKFHLIVLSLRFIFRPSCLPFSVFSSYSLNPHHSNTTAQTWWNLAAKSEDGTHHESAWILIGKFGCGSSIARVQQISQLSKVRPLKRLRVWRAARGSARAYQQDPYNIFPFPDRTHCELFVISLEPLSFKMMVGILPVHAMRLRSTSNPFRVS